MNNQFKGKQHDYRIIIEALGLYYHFGLSCRDCTKIMHKFSMGVHHTTIYLWNKQYGKTLYHGETGHSLSVCVSKPIKFLTQKSGSEDSLPARMF